MKKSEYDDIIKNLNDPDKMAEAIVALSDKLEADEADYNSILESRDSLKTSNDTLRDTNSRLALRVTQTVDDLVKTADETRDYFKELTDDIVEGYKHG